MSPAEIEQRITDLCADAVSVERTSDSVVEYEEHMVEIIRTAQRHPELRQVVVGFFIDVIEGRREAPSEFAPFCMRTLRYPEVLAAMHSFMNLHRGTERYVRSMNFCSDLVHAYEDKVWQHADLWPYYSHERKNVTRR